MAKYLICLMCLMFLMTGCAGAPPLSVTPTVTPNPGEIALQLVQQQMAAVATQQVVELQLQATQHVENATATANQMIVDAQQTEQTRKDAVATASQERANIAATQSRMDADAATQQARGDAQSTQSALATATFVAMTLSAVPTSDSLTAIANQQLIALNNNKVVQSNHDTTQQPYEWVIRLLFALAAVIVGAVMGIRWSRTRVVSDEDGNVRVMVFDNQKVLAPKLLHGPVLDLESMSMPTMTDPKTQADVTRMANTVEAIRAMPAMNSNTGGNDLIGMFQPSKPRFEVSAPPTELLDIEAVKSIESDWAEKNRGENG